MTPIVERRAYLEWIDGAKRSWLIVEARRDESTDSLRNRANDAGWKRNGLRSRGSTSFTLTIQERTVTPWSAVDG